MVLDTMICAYSVAVGSGTCDEGPLLHKGKLIGITSWIIKVKRACAVGLPYGYTCIN